MRSRPTRQRTGRPSRVTSPRQRTPRLPAAILALGPVGYWKLDEASGNFADSSGNGRTMTNNGITHRGTDGYASLTGTAYAEAADAAAFSNTASGLTVFAAVKPDTVTTAAGDYPILCKSGPGASLQREWAVMVNGVDGGGAEARIIGVKSQLTGGTIRSGSVINVVTTNWQAVAVTIPPGNGTTDFTIYRNNATDIRNLATGAGGTWADGTGTLRLGQYQFGGGQFLGGLAHVALFPGVLNASQVGELMAAAAADGFV